MISNETVLKEAQTKLSLITKMRQSETNLFWPCDEERKNGTFGYNKKSVIGNTAELGW